MKCGRRRRKWLLRYVGVSLVVLGLGGSPNVGWAGSVDPGTDGESTPDGSDSETCLETVQEWLEDGETRFVDWGGHGRCRPDSGRVRVPEPKEVTTQIVEELQTWILDLLRGGRDRE